MEITIITTEVIKKIFGEFDKNLKLIERAFGVRISLDSSGNISAAGDNIEGALAFIDELKTQVEAGNELSDSEVERCLSVFAGGTSIRALDNTVAAVNYKGGKITPKTINQRKLIESAHQNEITFAIGPAGTGKTFLAVALAAAAYKRNEVDRIVLTRPAIESGEKLGFLPGDLMMKVDPYLKPLYDALYDIFGADGYKLTERGTIEVAPLAYMRGRTLKRAFIILDEAQNTTKEQMKMFLTRMGEQARVIVTGDATQIDLPDKSKSGLTDAARILSNVEGVGFVYLNGNDVVRSSIVQRIVEAYERE